MMHAVSSRYLVIDSAAPVHSVADLYEYISDWQEEGNELRAVRLTVSVAERIIAGTPAIAGNLAKVKPGTRLFGLLVV